MYFNSVCRGVQVLVSEQEKREQTKLIILGVWQEMVSGLRCGVAISSVNSAAFIL